MLWTLFSAHAIGRRILPGGVKPTDVLADVRGAHRLLTERTKIDPERIGLTGMCFGAVQTMLMMTRRYSDAVLGQERQLQAGLAFYPVCFPL